VTAYNEVTSASVVSRAAHTSVQLTRQERAEPALHASSAVSLRLYVRHQYDSVVSYNVVYAYIYI
jgi:hypothetical protein